MLTLKWMTRPKPGVTIAAYTKQLHFGKHCMKLNKATLALIQYPIERTWENIGSDIETLCAEDGNGRITNAEALEATLDADYVAMYGSKVANTIIHDLFNEHGYDKAMDFFKKNIKLVW